VCFVGDSITKGGSYHMLIESLYAAKFPERRIRYYKCGVGGDRASAVMSAETFRVKMDVLGHKPTVATVMLGMNDVERAGMPEQREAAMATDYEALSERLRSL
jgi:lysophospholipase L1-like esterase